MYRAFLPALITISAAGSDRVRRLLNHVWRAPGKNFPDVAAMTDRAASHCCENLELPNAIVEKLRSFGKDLTKLTTADLVIVEEFHIQGRRATRSWVRK
jgi:hypothetical protein